MQKVDDESVKYYNCVMPYNEENSDLTSKLIVLHWKTAICKGTYCMENWYVTPVSLLPQPLTSERDDRF